MNILFHNGRVLTQADGVRADSIVVRGGTILAVGRKLEHDSDFKSFSRFDLKGKTIIPGLVDAHTHFFQVALAYGRLSLVGMKSIASCQKKILEFANQLSPRDWVVGYGYAIDLFPSRREPDRDQLDAVTSGRPAFVYSKDNHSAWVNSRALEIAGISTKSSDPTGGRIERDDSGRPTGILREGPAIDAVWKRIPPQSRKRLGELYRRALAEAYRKGVTGVHSFDDAEAFSFYASLAEKGKLGLRINYYPRAHLLGELTRSNTRYGAGDEFLRVAGIKLFADGALGSRTALCFHRYRDGNRDFGIEVTSVTEMKSIIKRAARHGFPCAIHAIGDRAAANVLDAIEQSPKPKNGARHRIEHLQFVRRKDLARIKRLGVIASMQPSHCVADIEMVRKAWGKRGSNAYIFRTLLERGIDLAFGSDAPIEPLDPLAGIAAAARRSPKGKQASFYPEQKLSAEEALHAYTVGPAVAAGEADRRGRLLPGYPADLVILREDITRIAVSRLYNTLVLATMIDGELVFSHSSLKL